MELFGGRLYDLWSGLDDLLETGLPGTEEERGENEFFAALYANPDELKTFLAGMTGISTGEVTLLAARFSWKRWRTSSTWDAPRARCRCVSHSHTPTCGCVGFDLPVVEPIFTDYVKSFGLDDGSASSRAISSTNRCPTPT